VLGLGSLLHLGLSLSSFRQITVSKFSKKTKKLADKEYKMVIKKASVVILVFLTSFLKLLAGRFYNKYLLL
jgi:hypothetical protein